MSPDSEIVGRRIRSQTQAVSNQLVTLPPGWDLRRDSFQVEGKNVSGASRKRETLNYDAFSFLARQRFSEAPGKMNEHSPG